MRILYISDSNSTNTRVWVNWFVNHGHKVCLISDTLSQIDWSGMEIYNLPGNFNVRIIRFLIWEIWTRQILNIWQPDILHVHRVSSAGWLGVFSNFHPFVVTPWGSDLLIHPNRSIIARILAQIVLRKADLITLNSKTLLNKAIQYGAEPSHCHLISWGVDLKIFHPEKTNKLREELGIDDAPVILSPRGMKPIYNQDIIIESIPLVKSKFPKVIYLIQDYNIVSNYKDQLLKRIDELGISSSVRWLSFQTPNRYVDYFRMSNAVISVPSSDSIPSTILEALACGAPVIVSDLPSLREIITHQVNGLIVPPKNTHTLAQATIELLNNPQMREMFFQYNTEWVLTHANREIEMEKMEILYKNIL